VLNNSKVYTNVIDNTQAFVLHKDSLMGPSSIMYSIDNMAEAEILKNKIAEDVVYQTTQGGLKRLYAIITVHEQIDLQSFDKLIEFFEEGLSTTQGNFVVAILGNGQHPDHEDIRFINL